MKVMLIISLSFNIILAMFFWKQRKELEFSRMIDKYNVDLSKIDNSPISDDNFRKIFIEKNDTLYRDIYNKAFENSSAEAYLIACGYYYVTRNKRAKEDIEQTYKEMKALLK